MKEKDKTRLLVKKALNQLIAKKRMMQSVTCKLKNHFEPEYVPEALKLRKKITRELDLVREEQIYRPIVI